MNIQELVQKYAALPQVSALAKELGKSSKTTVFLDGLLASSAPMLFASLTTKISRRMLFVLQDAEEAGYFYHDLTQLLGTDNVLFFPSSYRRAVKYAQRDPASEILRTEVLSSFMRNEELEMRNDDSLFLKTDYRIVKVSIPDIRYIEGMSEYLKVWIEGEPKPIITLLY